MLYWWICRNFVPIFWKLLSPPIFRFCPWLKSSERVFRTFFCLEYKFRNVFSEILPNLHSENFEKRVPNFSFKGKIGKLGRKENFPYFLTWPDTTHNPFEPAWNESVRPFWQLYLLVSIKIWCYVFL
jgi:hypothetical protein